MNTSVDSGVDQLKEEKLRYVAATALELTEEQSEDCWDRSSEENDAMPSESAALDESVTSSAAGAETAESQPERQQEFDCHGDSLEHARLTAAVKKMLQQDSKVRDKACMFSFRGLLPTRFYKASTV